MKYRLGGWSGLLCACALAFPASVLAHPHLVKSRPASGDVLTASPARITLAFSEGVEVHLTRAMLVDSFGDSVRISGFQMVSGERNTMEAGVKRTLGPGRYVVLWSCVGTDGHSIRGRFSFVIDAGGSKSGQPPAPRSRSAIPLADNPSEESDGDSGGIAGAAARTATFAGILLLLGAVAFRYLVLPRSGLTSTLQESSQQLTSLLGMSASVIVLLSAAARVIIESKTMAAISGLDSFSTRRLMTETQWGGAMEVLIVAAILSLVGFFLSRRTEKGWILAASAGLAAALAVSLSGHAGSVERFPRGAVAMDALHLMAASCWIGNLFSLAVAGLPVAFRGEVSGRWQNVAGLVGAFSPVAMIATAMIVLTGVFSAWVQLERFQNLFGTTYGRVLLFKVGLFGLAAGIGAYNYLIVTPTLGSEKGSLRLTRSVRAELAVGLLILIVAGFLTGLSTK